MGIVDGMRETLRVNHYSRRTEPDEARRVRA